MEAPLEFDQVSSSSMRNTFAILFFVISVGLIGFALHSLSSGDSPRNSSTSQSTFHPYQTITIDIQGAVRNPGVQKFSIPFDEQVHIYEAIEKAGGLSDTADSSYIAKNINLAGNVQDGQKLYIPHQNERESTAGETTGTMNINTASLSELMNLKGVGKARAESIISARPYANKQSLSKKANIPISIVEGFADEISF